MLVASLLLRYEVNKSRLLDDIEGCFPDHDTAEALADSPLGLGSHHRSVIIANPLVSRVGVRADLS